MSVRGAMNIEMVGRRLVAAHDFVQVAIAICELTREMAIEHCEVVQQTHDGRPLIVVDNISDLGDEDRRNVVEDLARDPLQCALRVSRLPVERNGRPFCTLLLPILRSGGLLGSIRCCRSNRFVGDLRRDLTTLAQHASVRLAELGIGSSPDPRLAELTPRQLEVAALVSRLSNPGISAQLKVSENTVKKHLKDIFSVLEIGSRSELALLVRRAPRSEEPSGITRRGDITITRP